MYTVKRSFFVLSNQKNPKSRRHLIQTNCVYLLWTHVMNRQTQLLLCLLSFLNHLESGQVSFLFSSTAQVCSKVMFSYYLSVCLSLCFFLSVTYEPFDLESSFLVRCYILTIFRSSLSIKVIE